MYLTKRGFNCFWDEQFIVLVLRMIFCWHPMAPLWTLVPDSSMTSRTYIIHLKLGIHVWTLVRVFQVLHLVPSSGDSSVFLYCSLFPFWITQLWWCSQQRYIMLTWLRYVLLWKSFGSYIYIYILREKLFLRKKVRKPVHYLYTTSYRLDINQDFKI